MKMDIVLCDKSQTVRQELRPQKIFADDTSGLMEFPADITGYLSSTFTPESQLCYTLRC